MIIFFVVMIFEIDVRRVRWERKKERRKQCEDVKVPLHVPMTRAALALSSLSALCPPAHHAIRRRCLPCALPVSYYNRSDK
jgi:hypothetical protein